MIYRADIDGLRAIAVLGVIGFHAFPQWVQGGFVGVDVFFVISGFLISTLILERLEQNRFHLITFYSRRIRRIFPALLVMMVTCYVWGWFQLSPCEYKQLGKHIAAGATFLSNFVLWGEGGYFDAASETKPLLHLWSLAIEEQFYIVWPLILWVGKKKPFNLLLLIMLIGGISFAWNINVTDAHSPIKAFYMPHTRFWELCTGGILAYLYLHHHHLFLKKVLGFHVSSITSALGIIILIVSIFTLKKGIPFPGWRASLPVVGTALMIASKPQSWMNRRVLSHPFLVNVGLISFPLYLWHWPLLVFFCFAHEKDTSSYAMRVLMVLLSFCLSWLTYRWIESPLRVGRFKSKTSIILILVAFMMLMGSIGYMCHHCNGFPLRLPFAVRDLFNGQSHYQSTFRTGSCFLRQTQDASSFDACPDVWHVEHKKTILLWGSSYSAHLYHGYASIYGAEYNIVQRTAYACPPLLGREFKGRPHCKTINDFIFEQIKKHQPYAVVLSYTDAHPSYLQCAEKTLGRLREIGIKNIIVVGPVPVWTSELPKQLYLYFKKYGTVPSRMQQGLNQNFCFKADIECAALCRKMKVHYVSACDVFCNQDGCLTRLGDTYDDLTAWDHFHLTPRASTFLVSKIPKLWLER